MNFPVFTLIHILQRGWNNIGNNKYEALHVLQDEDPQIDEITVRLLLFSCSVCLTLCDPHGLQNARWPCPSPTPGACSNSCPLSDGISDAIQPSHLTISSSVALFSCRQSFLASGSFPVSQLFTSGSQMIRTSVLASVLPMNIQG